MGLNVDHLFLPFAIVSVKGVTVFSVCYFSSDIDLSSSLT